MNSCPFQRARSPEQKAERRAQILEAAALFFAEQRFAAISLAAIARQSGVTKAALYRYFPSKEALFLALYLSELDAMVEAPLPQEGPAWAAISELLIARPLFCRLTSILHTVLEHNLDESQAREFKQALLASFAQLAARLQHDFALDGDQAIRFLMQVQQSVIGCWAVSQPAPVVATVIKTPPLDVFQVEFGDALRTQLRALQAAL
ncbi:TetR/AcrR family transcriptional regulator [uncultured Alcanivorax sp.]|uniref:TetR/AcrR family transcriptional regulator n=1 Tax=Alcanivorax sp. TaxID=1872427 RepID=UPI0025DC3753|nr:TetR family transcriptional regulator [uncultured Alcanivorax sp.]